MGKLWDQFRILEDRLKKEEDPAEQLHIMDMIGTFIDDHVNEWTGLDHNLDSYTADIIRLANVSIMAGLFPLIRQLDPHNLKLWKEGGKKIIQNQIYAALTAAYNLGREEADPNVGLESIYREFLEGDDANHD
jgi:hypothetical protein